MPIRRLPSGCYFAGFYEQAPKGPNNEEGRNAAHKDEVSAILKQRFFASEDLGFTAYKFFNQIDTHDYSMVEFTGWNMKVPPGALAPTIGVFKKYDNGALAALKEYVGINEAIIAARQYEQRNGIASYANVFLKSFGPMMTFSRA